MLYDPRRSNIAKIEREAGIKFEHVSAPQPDEIAKAMGGDAAEMITEVSDRYACDIVCSLSYCVLTLSSAANTRHVCSVIPAFKSAAEELLNNSGLSAVELLAKALAKAVVSTSPFNLLSF